MSYTAPQYVDTKEQAVLALASTIADEDKTALGDGSVNTALDVLADVLAGQDVEVPQTNAGAILALAQYVGGGGSSDFTTAQVTFTYTHEETGSTGFSLPTVNEAESFPFETPATSESSVSIDSNFDGETVPVILYKGLCTAYYDGTGTVTTSGNITYLSSNHQLSITGDGSITIS